MSEKYLNRKEIYKSIEKYIVITEQGFEYNKTLGKIKKIDNRETIDNLLILGLKQVLSAYSAFTRQNEKENYYPKWEQERDGFRHKKRRVRLDKETLENIHEREEKSFVDFTKNMMATINEYTESVLNKWKMDNGMSLGEMRAGDLRKYAENEKNKANGHMKTSQFYFELSESLSDDVLIKDGIRAQKAEEIKNRIFSNNTDLIRDCNP